MVDVREIIARWIQGDSQRKIARDTGTDRGTVARYVRAAIALALPTDREPSPSELIEVAARVCGRSPRRKRPARDELMAHRERVANWLARQTAVPPSLRQVHKMLVRKHGLKVSYATFLRFVETELGGRKPVPQTPKNESCVPRPSETVADRPAASPGVAGTEPPPRGRRGKTPSRR